MRSRTRSKEQIRDEEMGRTALEGLLMQFPAGRSMVQLFDLVEVADQELTRARVPKDRSGGLNELYPGGAFQRMNVELYRHHCRELAERMRDGESTDRGTLAEVCMIMSERSQKAPLTQYDARVYRYAFAHVFSDRQDVHGGPLDANCHGAENIRDEVERDVATLRDEIGRKVKASGGRMRMYARG